MRINQRVLSWGEALSDRKECRSDIEAREDGIKHMVENTIMWKNKCAVQNAHGIVKRQLQ